MKQLIVIKIGGSLLMNDLLLHKFSKEIFTIKKMGYNVIIVHGGGKHISKALEDNQINSHFFNGYRLTSSKEIPIIADVLCKNVNKMVVKSLMKHQLKAIGIHSFDKPYLVAESKVIGQHKMDHVGTLTHLDKEMILYLLNKDYVPVIAPLGTDKKRKLYNINADEVAGFIGANFEVKHLVFLTDVEGISFHGANIQSFGTETAKEYLKNGLLVGGMVPKVESCIEALEGTTKYVHIIKGEKNNILKVIQGEFIGTTIIRS